MNSGWIRAGVVGVLALGLAACGGTSAAPVESASDSGSAAFFGTKGVEVNFKNGSGQPLYVWLRGGGAVETVAPGGSKTFQGEESVVDDVELNYSWSSDGSPWMEMDFSNPTAGEPTVSFSMENGGDWSIEGFSVNEVDFGEHTQDGRSTKYWVKRIGDSSDYKRFNVEID